MVVMGRRAEVPVPRPAVPQLTQSPPLIWPQVQDLFEAKGNDRLKLLVLYSGEDDELLRRAAAGGLAMLTSMRPSLCSRIPEVVSAFSRWRRGHGPGTPCTVAAGGWEHPRAHECVPARSEPAAQW